MAGYQTLLGAAVVGRTWPSEHGVHQCLGHNPARAELEIAYRTLFERFSQNGCEGEVADLSFRYTETTFGLCQLPVTW